MLPLLIFGALAALIGGVVLLANWNAVVSWFRDFLPKVRKALKKIKDLTDYYAKVLADKVIENGEHLVRFIHRMVYKKDGQLVEKTTTRMCPESDVPDWVMEKVNKRRGFVDWLLNRNKQKDITEDIENRLQLEV